MNNHELITFTFFRLSLFRDFKLFHNKDEDEVVEIIRSIIRYCPIEDLIDSIKISYEASILKEGRLTHYFNQYLTGYLMMFYSDSQYIKHHLSLDEDIPEVEEKTLDYNWVIESDFLTRFERQIVYARCIYGSSVVEIADKFNVTPRMVNHYLQDIEKQLQLS